MTLMRKCIINLLLLLCMIGAQAQNTATSSTVIPVSRNEAVSYAAQMYSGSDSVNYYVSESLVHASHPGSGPIIWQPSKPLKVNGSNAVYLKNYWLVFVDLQPQAGWDHQCKYIYVSKERNANMNPLCWSVDSVCPPANIKLLPAKIQVKYQSKAPVKKVAPGSNASGGANPAAGHTYAVIISGGLVPTANKERYWNDCSFIYQTLHTTYGVPRDNIKVIMADGTDPGEDMMNDNDELVSSPLDLDGDGTDDVQYAATKENVKTVFDGLKNLGDNDHLFVFVTDHGGRDKAKNKSYIKLWKDERLYPEELDSCLNNVNAGYITVLLGQCYSGGFVKDLKRTNRIVLTACQDNELSYGCRDIPYDEFLYRWTSAINGKDAYGYTVDVSKDKHGKITIKNAARYAVTNDMYTQGKYKYAEETPSCTYFQRSVAEDLALDTIPNVIDLCFDKHLVSDNSVADKFIFATKFPDWEPIPGTTEPALKKSFWHDDNIWVRNEKTGDTCRTNDKIYLSDEHPYFYTYAKVTNRGVKTYKPNKGRYYFNGCWAKASMCLDKDMWLGYFQEPDGHTYEGGLMASVGIKDSISPGSYTVVRGTVHIDESDIYADGGSDFPVCIIGYLSKKYQQMEFQEDSAGVAAVWSTDKLVQNNTIVKTSQDPIYANVLNFSKGKVLWNIFVQRDSTLDKLLSRAELYAFTDLKSVKSTDDQQGVPGPAGNTPEFKRVKFTGSYNILPKFEMNSLEKGRITVNCNFLADEAVTEQQTYDINLVLEDEKTGCILGGERFRIIQNPRAALLPSITVSSKTSNMAKLSVGNISESATYEWYDKDGNFLGTGKTISVPASANLSQYKVKVIADGDGAFNYAETSLTGTQSIQNVESDGQQTSVVLKEATDCDAKLQLSSVSGVVPTQEYSIGKGIQTCSIPTSGLKDGVYQVSLIENGHMIDTKKFVK